MKKKSFKELFDEARKSDDYWIARAKLDITENIYQLMEAKGMKKADLAKKIGKTPAYITKVFRGNANFTLETMVRLARALGGNLTIGVKKEEKKIPFQEIFRIFQQKIPQIEAPFFMRFYNKYLEIAPKKIEPFKLELPSHSLSREEKIGTPYATA
jgi:transcriptional regulator with XRE-family HTH domain